MSAICTAILLLAATGSDSDHAASAPSSSQSSFSSTKDESLFVDRKPAATRKAVSEALRATAVAKDRTTRDLAIRRLILILLELEQDQNLTHDERVELHTQVRARLISLQETLQAEIKRDQQTSAPQAKPSKATQYESAVVGQGGQTTASIRRVDQKAGEGLPVLAQVARAPAGVQQGAIPGGFPRGGVIGGGVATGSAQQADYGSDLVTLIQAVVAPRTWDVNGGPGSIVYYRNFQALVVRAPSEVHDQLGGVLRQLRK